MRRLGVIVTLCVLVSACGFHLRGFTPLPNALKHVHIDSQLPNSAFTKILRARLNRTGIAKAEPANDALILTIIEESHSQSPGAVGASTQTREYQLFTTITYQLSKNETLVVPPRKVQSQRTLLLDANRVLGSSREEQSLQKSMNQEISEKIINQLASPSVRKQLTR